MSIALVTIKTGTITLSAATSPDGAAGWTCQFQRNGANHGTADTTAPYGPKSADLPAGTYVLTAKWTKTGKATVIEAIGTAVIADAGATFTPASVPTPAPDPVPAPVPTPPPSPAPTLVRLCGENELATASGVVAYGANGVFSRKTINGSFRCDNATFGDPSPGVAKACYLESAAAPAPTPTPTPTPAPTPTPSPVPAAQKATLTAADIQYLGVMRMPDLSPSPLRLSSACLTGRRVNGQLRLLISGWRGQWQDAGNAYELVPPATLGPSVASAPRATQVGAWADIYGGKAGLQTGSLRLWSLHFDAEQDVLWWSYSADYAGGPHNPSLGASALHADGSVTAYGAWRTSSHSAQTSACLTPIPEWFRPSVGGARLAVGGPPHVNNAMGSFGANLQAFTPPALSSAADAVNDSTQQSARTTPLVFYPLSAPQQRAADFQLCGWNVNYDNSQGGYVRPALPQFGGGDSNSLLDWVDCAAWIDLPTKHGVVFLGQLATGHNWYGANPCVHGKNAPAHQATGPGSERLVHQAWVFNPNDLLAVASGAKRSHEIQASSTFRATMLGGFVPEERTDLYAFGGAYFDAPTGRLYVSQVNAEAINGSWQPVIHVFQVS